MSKLLRLQDNTPQAYVEDSRDFQLMLRLYDCVNNGVKFRIDSIPNVLDTKKCDASLLPLLRTKLGFFSEVEFPEKDLRYILRAFPYIMRNKGSKRAIEQAVYAFMHSKGISADFKITGDSVKHRVSIYISSLSTDTLMLEEMLKYVIPAGFSVDYVFYNPYSVSNDFEYMSIGHSLVASDLDASVLRGSNEDNGLYGFIEERTFYNGGYEISFTSIDNGNITCSFTASENSPHMYSLSKSWTSKNVGGEWKFVEDNPTDLSYGIFINTQESGSEVSSISGVVGVNQKFFVEVPYETDALFQSESATISSDGDSVSITIDSSDNSSYAGNFYIYDKAESAAHPYWLITEYSGQYYWAYSDTEPQVGTKITVSGVSENNNVLTVSSCTAHENVGVSFYNEETEKYITTRIYPIVQGTFSLYDTTIEKSWTNYSNEILGSVGSVGVIGSNTNQQQPPIVQSFDDKGVTTNE